jgi:DNA-directed RNA polymerase subunit RPC12/RpoP
MDINDTEIARRGGQVYGDEDFVVVQCTRCSAQFLYDEEILLLYPDPQDLSRQVLNIHSDTPLPCPQCGDEDWDFTNCESEAEVRGGRWGWILS